MKRALLLSYLTLAAALTGSAGGQQTQSAASPRQVVGGAIRVIKNTVGGDDTFSFNSNFGVSAVTTVNGLGSQDSGSLAPGSNYSVSESVPSGWTQTGAGCSNGTPQAVTVVANVWTTCTFTNTKIVAPPPTGTIQVVKITTGGDGTFSFSSNFGASSLSTTNGSASQTFSGLAVGSNYFVSESVPSGWTQTGASCSNGTPAAVNVVANSTTTCTFTNTKIVAPPPTGTIQVVKITTGGDGTFAFSSNFGASSLSTTNGSASQTFSGLAVGSSYFVSESVPSGWTQTGASCSNGTPAAVNVVANSTTTCTFTNTKIVAPPPTGTIQVVKITTGGDGTFAFSSNFGASSLSTTNGSASQTFSGLAVGSSYFVSESVPSGWTQTGASCSNGTPAAVNVVANSTTTCTFTNTKIVTPPPTGTIQVVKITTGGDGTFAFSSNFGASSLSTTNGSASQTFSGLAVGSNYFVSESVPSGWTQTGASCSNGTPAAVNVIANSTTICTFLNTRVTLAPPDLTIRKTHVGNFRQGDLGVTYTLTVTNTGAGPTTGAVTVNDILPAGLTAVSISGAGWNCTLTPLSCTRSDALSSGASYPLITVSVNVATGAANFPVTDPPSFRTGDLLISMADGSVQWRRPDWTLVKTLAGGSDGQAKGMGFDTSGRLYVTHWTGTNSSGNNVERFDQFGNPIGIFGSGFDCNPSSIVFDASGNAYVGQADCGAAIIKFDALGHPLAQYIAAIESRGTYYVILDPNQCTLYYTSEGGNVKRFDICGNTQLANFNTAPLPDPTGGAQALSLLPSGGMLVANFSVIARLNSAGNLLGTYKTATGDQCWLGLALDPDGASFWASNWCTSSVTRFSLATGAEIVSHVADPRGFQVKQIFIPGHIFSFSVSNTATVSGGGELNITNNSASDLTIVHPPATLAPAPNNLTSAAGLVSAVSPGSIGTIFGSNLAPELAVSDAMPLPTALAGSSIQIGGRAAPLFYASPTQVNLQIPWELSGQDQTSVSATVGSLSSTLPAIRLATFAPALFTLNGTGPQGVILIAGTTLVAAPASVPSARPVRRGEYISIYSTGLGPVTHQPATGAPAQADPLSMTISTPTVEVGSQAALVTFAGLAPNAVGLYQVNVQIPADAASGDAVPVTLRIGGVKSNTVTIAIQ